MPPQNLLKQRIKDGEIVVALRLPIDVARKQVEFALSKGDYHLLYIDGQHSAYSDAQIVAFCALAEELGLPVQLRIPHTRLAYLIGRYLDLGLSSVMVPEVEEEATVEEAIAYAYYPQVGKRSWGGDARHGLKAWGGPVERVAYAEWWNRHVVLGIQFESVAAISNARALAKPDVDYIAFGPNDLHVQPGGPSALPAADRGRLHAQRGRAGAGDRRAPGYARDHGAGAARQVLGYGDHGVPGGAAVCVTVLGTD